MLVVYALLLVVLLHAVYSTPYLNHGSLQLVAVIFRHGDRTKDNSVPEYPKDPYINFTYQPYGVGELTNRGKRRSFKLGRELSERYYGYLGSHYTTDDISAVSTDYSRTKDSLLLVLNALFGTMNNFHPSKSLKQFEIKTISTNNSVLSFPHKYCPRFKQLYKNFLNSESGKKFQSKHVPIYQYLQEHTGINVTNLVQVCLIYDNIRVQREWGLKLPEWVTNDVYRYLKSVATDTLDIWTSSPEFRRMNGGGLLKEILENMEMKISTAKQPKMYLYSAHDVNISALLGAMHIFRPHMPYYTSCVAIELYEINKAYYLKVLYRRNAMQGFKEMVLPGCEAFCTIEKFKTLIRSSIPGDKDKCDLVDP